MQPLYKQILIIEDNERSMRKVCAILKNIDNIIILKAKNSEQAYRYALEYNIDLFIVDIILNTSVLGDVAGIQFVERIRTIERYEFTPIIFTTALEDAQLHAYAHLHCYRYFEKPYDSGEFYQTVISALRFKTVKEKKAFYYYKMDGVIYSVKIQNIVYIENNRFNVLIHCEDGTILYTPYKSCKQVLLELNSEKFLKCNKNTIVNVDFIENVDAVNRYIKLVKEYGTLEIGQRLKSSFLKGLASC